MSEPLGGSPDRCIIFNMNRRGFFRLLGIGSLAAIFPVLAKPKPWVAGKQITTGDSDRAGKIIAFDAEGTPYAADPPVMVEFPGGIHYYGSDLIMSATEVRQRRKEFISRTAKGMKYHLDNSIVIN